MTKPSDSPDWATDANYNSGPDNGTPTKVKPASGEIAQGFLNGAVNSPSAQAWNWLAGNHGDWIGYLEDTTDGLVTDVSTLQTDVNAVETGLANETAARIAADEKYAQELVVLTTSGTYEIPADILAIHVIAVGGGGGGSGGQPNSAGLKGGGGGGGGAWLTEATFQASDFPAPGIVTYVIGAGGAGGAVNSPGIDGGETSFSTTSTAMQLVAPGGKGGGKVDGLRYNGGEGYSGGGGGGNLNTPAASWDGGDGGMQGSSGSPGTGSSGGSGQWGFRWGSGRRGGEGAYPDGPSTVGGPGGGGGGGFFGAAGVAGQAEQGVSFDPGTLSGRGGYGYGAGGGGGAMASAGGAGNPGVIILRLIKEFP